MISKLVCLASLGLASAWSAPSTCGNLTIPPDPKRKANVLIVGDSISMAVPYTPGGYGINVQQLLEPLDIAVQHAGGWYAGGQCSNTVKGLLCTAPDAYLNFTGTFDVVHMNYGLHDLENCTTGCPEHVDPDVYAANVVTLLTRWQPRAKHLIFALTTPVPDVVTSYGRSYQLAVEYNAVAVAAIKKAFGDAVTINDLWSSVIGQCGALYKSCPLQLPANVHFEPLGQAFLGTVVANKILQVLGMQ